MDLFPIRKVSFNLRLAPSQWEISGGIHATGDQNTARETKIEKLKEFAVYLRRCFHNPQVLIGAGAFGNNLADATRKKPSSSRGVLPRGGESARLSLRSLQG